VADNECVNCGTGLDTDEQTSPFCSLDCQEEFREFQIEQAEEDHYNPLEDTPRLDPPWWYNS
jgi:hypothetical protein